MKIKWSEKAIDTFGRFYAGQISMGWLTLDEVPAQFKERTQYYVDLANQEQEMQEPQNRGCKIDMWKPEFLSMILSASVSVLTLFTFFQSRMTNSERRTTILEENAKQRDKELVEIKKRLDNHDKQNEALIRLTTEITNLSEKVEKIDNKLEEIS